MPAAKKKVAKKKTTVRKTAKKTVRKTAKKTVRKSKKMCSSCK